MNRKERRAASGNAPSAPKRAAAPSDPLLSALRHYPGPGLPDAAGFAGLGDWLRGQQRLVEAEACYRQSVALQPGFAVVHNNLGAVLDMQGKLTEAVASYRRALAITPDAADVHYNLGNALREQGKKAEAMEAFHDAAAFGQPAARHMLAVMKGQTTERPPEQYVANLFDNYAGQFESHLVDDLGYATPATLRRMLGDTDPGRRFAHVADLGCGTGLMGAAFRDVAGDLTGIDLAPKMIEQARAKGIYQRLVTAEAVSFLTADTARFDLFLAADVLIYVGAVGPLFAAIAARANPDVRFAFSAEISADADYALLPSGRYAQSRPYLEAELARVGGRVVAWETSPIRVHGGQALDGYHVIAGF